METSKTLVTSWSRVPRRGALSCLALAGIGVVAAACAPVPAPNAPTPAKPTTAPVSPAKPTAAAAAPTAAPVKRTYTPAKVKLASSTSPRGESARLVGIKQGFFKDFGVDLEVLQISGTPDILRATVNNESTFATVDVPTTLAAMAGGLAIKFLGSHEAKLGHIIFARPEIKTLKDLEGKSIGTTAVGGLIDNIERAILKQAGVDESKVEFISLKGSSGIYQALAAGKIDAGAVTDAFLPSAQRDGLVVLVKTWEALPNYVSSVFLATDSSIKDRRDLIVRTLAGFAKTFRFLSDPSSKAVWVAEATNEIKQEPEEAETAWQSVYESQVYRPDFAFTRVQFDYAQEPNLASGKQQAPIPYERATDFTLVKEALALL